MKNTKQILIPIAFILINVIIVVIGREYCPDEFRPKEIGFIENLSVLLIVESIGVLTITLLLTAIWDLSKK